MSTALALQEPPREAKTTQAAFMLRVVAVFAIVTCMIIADVFATADVSQLKELAVHGRRVNATVTSKSVHRSKSTTYWISFEYTAEGVYIDSSDTVNMPTYEGLHVGDPFPITYLPSDTTVYRTGIVDIDRANHRQSIWIFWVALGTLAAAAVWSVLEHEVALQRDLMAFGEEAEAVVVRNSPPMKGSRSSNHTIEYEIKTPHGRAWGSFTLPPALAADYQNGRRMAALYDPSDVHRSRIVQRMQYASLGP